MHVKHNKTMKITTSSEICKTTYHNGSCFMLFGNKQKKTFEISNK